MCYEKKIVCNFVFKQVRGLVALLVHVWICHNKADSAATMVWITRRKKVNFIISSNTWLRTLVALQVDARPWLSFYNNNGGC